MLAGKLFHRVATAFVKVLSPYVTVRVRGTVNRMVASDRKERALHFIPWHMCSYEHHLDFFCNYLGKSIRVQISTNVYSQVLCHTAD